MPDPLSSRRAQLRQQRIARRLVALLETLGTVDRRAPLPRDAAGAARRTLRDAAALVGPDLAPPRTRRPADLFVGVLRALAALAALKRHEARAARRAAGKIYPRAKSEA